MKQLMVILLACFIWANAVEATDITFSIDIPKMLVVVEKHNGEIPQIPDSTWIDPDDGSEAPLVNEYTDQEYVEKYIVDYLVGQEERFRKADAKRAALSAVVKDDTVVRVKKR